ncbi:MAG: nucleotidyltransferase [Chloroflexi bacterium]|nr:nucleotidyltransferase [Chloroflexota bacterium]
MRLNTDFLFRCIGTLELAFEQMQQHEPGDFINEVFRSACVKEFELISEQSGVLLKKRIRPYFASNRQVDELIFRDIFRYAAKHGLISIDACERWLVYRTSRNNTAHRYGEDYAEATLELLPQFIEDAKELAQVLAEAYDA